jgi:hypothetical protein
MVVPGIKCSQKIFQQYLRSLDRYKYPFSLSLGLSTGSKGDKVALFGFSTGVKGEKFNFYSFLNIKYF